MIVLRVTVSVLVLLAGNAAAAPVPVSAPEQTPATAPDAARLADGGAVVVYTGAGTDGRVRVYRRLLGATGAPGAAASAVDGNAAGDASRPAVAVQPDGRTAVAWLEEAGGPAALALQLLDPDGGFAAGLLRPQGTDATTASDLDLAARPDGGWVVVWARLESLDPGRESVVGRLLDAAGSPASPVFGVSDDAGVFNIHPRVAVGPDGGFVVAWGGYSPAGADIRLRRFAPDGTSLAPARVEAADASFPAVARDTAGRTALAWGSTAGKLHMTLRRLDPDGTAIGTDARLPVGGSACGRAAVACAPDGAALVLWPPDGASVAGDLWGAVFNAGGDQAAPPRVLNATPVVADEPGAAILGPDGAALAVWAGTDGTVMAEAWTEAAVPTAPAGWGDLRGLYRAPR